MSKWISVKDRLPETVEDVISYNKETGIFHIGFFEGADDGKPFFTCRDTDTHFYPECWMPLPGPPKGEQDE